jgi:hypothetical protein
MSRPKGSKNKKGVTLGKLDKKLKEVNIEPNPDASKIIVESGKPEYHEDGTIKVSGRYDKLINGTVYLYCYGDECWKNLKTCNEVCHKDNCPSKRLYEGNPIIRRRTQREMKKGKK